MRKSRVGLVAGLFLAAVLLSARPADAQSVFYYRGPHAVPSAYGGFCHISVRHFHSYKPDDAKVFRYDDNTYVFMGDPTAHGWTGPRVSYYGHHPIANGWGGGWCFIGGPHFHHYRTYGQSWRWHGGAYYWGGAFTDPWYLRHRHIYSPIFANYYVGRHGYVRPVIYAGPPRLYAGPRVTVPVAAWRGPTMRVPVGGPRVGIGGPRVGIGGPRVGVGAPGVRPGMAPGARPGMAPGARPGVAPGARPGMAPGMSKVGPAARPGTAPGARPGMAPGMNKAGAAARPGMAGGRPTPGRGPGMAPAPGRGAGMAAPRSTPGRGPGMAPSPGRGGGMSPGGGRSVAPTPRPAATPRAAPAPSRGGGGGRRP